MKEKRNKRKIFFQINLDICKSTTPVWEEKSHVTKPNWGWPNVKQQCVFSSLACEAAVDFFLLAFLCFSPVVSGLLGEQGRCLLVDLWVLISQNADSWSFFFFPAALLSNVNIPSKNNLDFPKTNLGTDTISSYQKGARDTVTPYHSK